MPAPLIPLVAVQPVGLRTHLSDAVEAGGGQVVPPEQANVLVWTDPRDVDTLRSILAANPQIELVQLLWAGVESFARLGLFQDGRTWACGKGVYADPVAEHALMLALGGMRGLGTYARAKGWTPQEGTNLLGAHVTILGGGGITESLLRLLGPFETRTTVVRRSAEPMEGADAVVGPEKTLEALATADLVVVALSLTAETTGIIDAKALATMKPSAWLVNVARGQHVVTDDLVAALQDGTIAGAGLDVTDPEPLPEGHPLWSLDNVLITPHTGNTEAMAIPLISKRVTANVRRLAAGEPLIGLIDPALGY